MPSASAASVQPRRCSPRLAGSSAVVARPAVTVRTQPTREDPPERIVAFLRGVNMFGGAHSMAAIRDALARDGLANVATFLISGNIVFDRPPPRARATPATLERRIERVMRATFGQEIPVFVRSMAEVRRVLAALQPAPTTAFYLGLLKRELTPGQRQAIAGAAAATDEVQFLGAQFAVHVGAPRRSVVYKALEKALGASVTVRKVSTWARLASKFGDPLPIQTPTSVLHRISPPSNASSARPMPATRSRARQAGVASDGPTPSVSTASPGAASPPSKRAKREASGSSKTEKARKAATGTRPLFAFLRGVNVGGRTHSMASIAHALTAAGFVDVSTFLASGNVTLTPADDAASLADVEAQVERVLASLFGTPIPVMVRTMDDLERITDAITKDATATNVVLLKHALSEEQRGSLAALRTPADDLQPLEKEFVWYASTRMSESPLFKLSFEKRLGAAATTRTANTLRRLLQRTAV